MKVHKGGLARFSCSCANCIDDVLLFVQVSLSFSAGAPIAFAVQQAAAAALTGPSSTSAAPSCNF